MTKLLVTPPLSSPSLLLLSSRRKFTATPSKLLLLHQQFSRTEAPISSGDFGESPGCSPVVADEEVVASRILENLVSPVDSSSVGFSVVGSSGTDLVADRCYPCSSLVGQESCSASPLSSPVNLVGPVSQSHISAETETVSTQDTILGPRFVDVVHRFLPPPVAKTYFSKPVRIFPDTCFRCGERGHKAAICRNARICFRCSRTGHCARSCTSRSQTLPNSTQSAISSQFISDTSPPRPLSPAPRVEVLSSSSMASLRFVKETVQIRAKEQARSKCLFFIADDSISMRDVEVAMKACAPPGFIQVSFLG